MAIGKRQLVLATLVVALGAAVYLNWALSGNQLPTTDTVASQSTPTLGTAQLVNTSGSGKTTSRTASGTSSKSSSAVATSAKVEEYFAQATLSRQKARDTSIELLTKVLADAKSNDAAKKEAVAKAATISQNALKEDSIESLIKAKGYSDCVAYLEDSGCSVVVQKANGLQANDAITIKDIVNSQAGISYDKIKIVEAK